MTFVRSFTLAAALAALLGVGAASPIVAQSQSGQQQPAQFSEQDLQSYAKAATEVQRISEAYTPELQAAETPEQQQSIRTRATNEMIQAIENEGLSVDQYNQIVAAARQDPQVASQIEEYMQAEQ